MSGRFLNTCTNCNTVVEDKGLWVVRINKGPLSVTEHFSVGAYDDSFNLDTIDKEVLMKKYNLTEDEAEDAVMNGEPACPHCKSLNFYSYNEEMDGHLLNK